MKLHVKKGDTVKVLAGNDKGSTGKVLVVYPKDNRAIVEGLNKIKKHTKPNPKNTQGGIVEKEAPIHASNVMLVVNGKTTRVGVRVLKDEKTGKVEKVRYAKSTGDNI